MELIHSHEYTADAAALCENDPRIEVVLDMVVEFELVVATADKLGTRYPLVPGQKKPVYYTMTDENEIGPSVIVVFGFEQNREGPVFVLLGVKLTDPEFGFY